MSAKGTTWSKKDHKYLAIRNGKYVYSDKPVTEKKHLYTNGTKRLYYMTDSENRDYKNNINKSKGLTNKSNKLSQYSKNVKDSVKGKNLDVDKAKRFTNSPYYYQVYKGATKGHARHINELASKYKSNAYRAKHKNDKYLLSTQVKNWIGSNIKNMRTNKQTRKNNRTNGDNVKRLLPKLSRGK